MKHDTRTIGDAAKTAFNGAAGDDRTPYAEFSLTLYAFLSRLHTKLVERSANNVLFCSREGQFLSRLFTCYQESIDPADRIEARYFLVSRRSTLLAGLLDIDEEDFAGLRSSFPSLTNAGFLHSLSLLEHIETGHIDLEAPVDLESMRSDPAVRHTYELRRKEQSGLLATYISELTGSDDSALHVVDVGWRGSTQDHLTAALRDIRPVHGYYMGLVAERPIDNLDSKVALVFGPKSDSFAHYRVLKHFKMIWEYVLGADHGSVSGYESTPAEMSGRSVEPILDPVDVELADFNSVIGPLQQGIFEAFERLCQIEQLRDLDQTALQDLMARHHSRMLFFPTRLELSIAWHRGHYANFGDPWVKETPKTVETSALQRTKNLLTLVRRPGKVLHGFPPLTLYKLGLEWLIPVVGCYRRLREFPPRPFAKLIESRRARLRS